MEATHSDKMLDRIGVQTHLAFYDTAYNDDARVAALIKDLGIRHVRDSLNTGWAGQHTKIKNVAARARAKFTLTARNSDKVADFVRDAAPLTPVLAAIEGVNEWDNTGRANWATELRTHQQSLYSAVKANATLSNLPVLAPALSNPAKASALGSLSAYVDKGNAHAYPNAKEPQSWVTAPLQGAAMVSGDKPAVITETGYHNGFSDPDSNHRPVSEDVAAVYTPKLILDQLAAGVERTFIYELLDQRPDTGTNVEMHFGLVRNDYTLKPAFNALKKFTSLLSDPGPEFTPLSLDISVVSHNLIRQLLVGKRDGSYVLFLWRDAPVWDTSTLKPITVSSEPVSIYFPTGTKTVVVTGEVVAVTIPPQVRWETLTSPVK